jgi:catechol 2,3-dioxygenase-like lactoylglutathione lyase family enzyme
VIRATRIECVDLSCRDRERALAWYREHFGFEPLYEVSGGGIVIGRDGVTLCLFQVKDPATAREGYTGSEVAVRLFGFAVDEADFARLADEFSADPGLVWIDHPRYKSCITEDPDGHAIELIVNKAADQEPAAHA